MLTLLSLILPSLHHWSNQTPRSNSPLPSRLVQIQSCESSLKITGKDPTLQHVGGRLKAFSLPESSDRRIDLQVCQGSDQVNQECCLALVCKKNAGCSVDMVVHSTHPNLFQEVLEPQKIFAEDLASPLPFAVGSMRHLPLSPGKVHFLTRSEKGDASRKHCIVSPENPSVEHTESLLGVLNSSDQNPTSDCIFHLFTSGKWSHVLLRVPHTLRLQAGP